MSKLFEDPDVYPARTLWQPYAGLVELGLKDLETRETRTTLRGPLIVCAGLEVDTGALARVRAEMVPRVVSAEVFDEVMGRRGVAVAFTRVVGCRALLEEDRPWSFWWEPGAERWAWVLGELRALRPFAVTGKPGFFPIPRVLVHEALIT